MTAAHAIGGWLCCEHCPPEGWDAVTQGVYVCQHANDHVNPCEDC